MTADEFWQFCQKPENRNKFLELVRGEVRELPRPTRIHGVVASNVGFVLNTYVRRVPGYIATNGSGVVLERSPDTVVGPDVAYYTDANTFEELHPRWGDVPPVLAVEVLSPSDRQSEVSEKVSDYLRTGVKLVWLVDYEGRKVTVYRTSVPLVVIDENGELSGEDVLPGFTCRVGDFFCLPGERRAHPNPR